MAADSDSGFDVDYGTGDLVVCIEYYDPEMPNITADPLEVGTVYICALLRDCICGCGRLETLIQGKRVTYRGVEAGYPAEFFRKALKSEHIESLKDGLEVPHEGPLVDA